MKKMILALAAFVLGSAMMSAQDLAGAVEKYNAGAEALSLNDKAAALNNFQQALAGALECGEEGAEVAANCKNVIPGLVISIAKEYYNAMDFDTALVKVNEALSLADEYGNEDAKAEAEGLISQVSQQKAMAEGNNAFNAKDFAAAATSYKQVLAIDPANKNASIRLLQALTNAGDLEEAKAAYEIAVANGKEGDANKILGGAFLKQAALSLKAGNSTAAIAEAEESLNYTNNAQAYLIEGQAYSKIKKNNEAIKYFEKYLEADPNAKNAGQIALTVGALYQGAGNKTKALEFYKKAQSLGTDAKTYIDALSK